MQRTNKPNQVQVCVIKLFKASVVLIVCVSYQIKWSSSKQELLFTDFCEDSDNIEEGAEYNKVLWLL